MSYLIAFAGLPGSGKSTLASRLANKLQAVLLNKDEIRAALFAPADVDYSAEQNDLCMDVIYQLCSYHLRHHPDRPVIVDGRTYSKQAQVEALRRCAAAIPCQLMLIECICSEETVRQRLKQDEGQHVAADRTADLFDRVRASWEPLQLPRLTITTDAGSTEEHLAMIDRYLKQESH